MKRFIESNQKGLINIGACKVATKRGSKINIGYFGKSVSKLRKGLTINYYDHQGRGCARNQKSVRDMMEITNRFSSPSISKTIIINPVGGIYAKRYFISDYGKRRLTVLRKNRIPFTHTHVDTNERCNLIKIVGEVYHVEDLDGRRFSDFKQYFIKRL